MARRSTPRAPAPSARPVPALHLATVARPQGMALHAPPALAREAMRWTYVLRSRRRWVDGSRARQRNEEEARSTLALLGVGPAQLAELAASEQVVVRIPYRGEAQLWEARVFPWEYVLAAATRERRLEHGQGRPRALTVMRELQVQAPGRPAPDPRTLFAGGLRALFVEALPTELREHWDLSSERERLRAALPADAQWRVLSDPTAAELAAEVGAFRPQLIHVAGLDSHQGLRELRLHVGAAARVEVQSPGSPDSLLRRVDDVVADRALLLDGVLLRGDARPAPAPEGGREREGLEPGLPRLVGAQELGRLLGAGGHTAFLVSFNLWNTAARVAPLVVAEGAALAALGFQDAFDDALAEWVHACLWRELLARDFLLPQAFQAMWQAVRQLPESVDATGITLWAGAPLLGGPPVADPGRPAEPAAAAAPAPVVKVDIKPFAELNYAVLHNAQPLFEKFVIECDRPGDEVCVDVVVAVHMGAETARFERQVRMRHRRVALTRDIHVPLTAGVARAVREAISSSLHVEVRHAGRLLYGDTHRLRLLPVDQWRDNRRDGRWLPSFVQPRDPAVTQAVAQAQRYVRVLRDDPTAGFEGYQLADPADEESLRGVDRQVQALWSTLLHDWQLGYINPPPTYSEALDSQRLRLPGTVREQRAGTCIDLALLFAACLELVDIYPVVFLLEGHALPGWWRHGSFRDEYFEMPGDHFAEVVDGSATGNGVANAQTVAWHTGKASWREIRRWIHERKLVPIETVRLTEHCGFVEAIEAGVQALAERRDFDSMLDIVTARTEGVTPLPIRAEVA